MEDSIVKLICWIFATIFVAAVIAVGSIWGGFVLSTLWNWYAVPFTPIRLTLPFAIGLSCLISTLKGVRYRKHKKGTSGAQLIHVFLTPGLILLVGWIAHHYV